MSKHNIYIVTSIIIGILIMGVLGWAIFLNKKKPVRANDPAHTGQFSDSFGDLGVLDGYNKEMFGKAVVNKSIETDGVTNKDINKQKIKEAELTQIYTTPIAGAAIVNKGDIEKLRLSERTTGHVFDIRTVPDIKISRVMQTTIPRTQKAIFGSDSKWVIRQYLENNIIMTIYNRIVLKRAVQAEDSDKDISIEDVSKGIFLENNITDISYNSDLNKIFFIVKTDDGALGVLSNPDASEREVLWSSPLSGWSASFVDSESVAISQHAGNGISGIIYVLDIKTQKTKVIVSGKLGVSALLNKDATYMVYSIFNNNDRHLYVRSMINSEDAEVHLPTIAEKCVWSVLDTAILYCSVPDEMLAFQYPDTWYQGSVHFKDSLWKIDVKTGETEKIVAFNQKFNVEMDGVDLFFDEDELHLYLKNKTDQTLWMVTMPQVVESEDSDTAASSSTPVLLDDKLGTSTGTSTSDMSSTTISTSSNATTTDN